MIKYIMATTALKLFSLNSFTRACYRKIGNTVWQKNKMKRGNVNSYIKFGNLLVNLCDKYNIFHNGNRALEIGTGWMHFCSIYLRLHKNIHISMIDVWDNRQFHLLKDRLLKLKISINENNKSGEFNTQLLDDLLNAKDFNEIYKKLDLNYIICPDGKLNLFPEKMFDCIFSFNVLEHVPAKVIETEVEEFHKLLKPGGYSIHQIGIDDHLSLYDKKASPKNYLRYSDYTWKLFFENEVQYFNRLQVTDWLKVFDEKNFHLLEKVVKLKEIGTLPINKKYRYYSKDDWSCTSLIIVHQKPL